MTLFRKGQKVKLTPKSNAKFSGEVVGILGHNLNTDPGHFAMFELEGTVSVFSGNAWDIEVVSELPTEPGIYVSSNRADRPWQSALAYLNEAGEWSIPEYEAGDDMSASDVDQLVREWHQNNGGLTRLVPEA